MIRPNRQTITDKLRDPALTVEALRRARDAAARRHAAAGMPLLDWREGRIVATDATAEPGRKTGSDADVDPV